MAEKGCLPAVVYFVNENQVKTIAFLWTFSSRVTTFLPFNEVMTNY
jgi:hypothetical protein